MKRRLKLLPTRRRIMPIGFRPTLGGLWFMLGTLLIGLASIDADVNLLLTIFGFCFGAIVLNAFYGWRTLPLLSIRRIVPESVVAGQTFSIRYVVTNRSRFAVARNVLIEDLLPRRSLVARPEAFIAAIPPGATLTARSIVVATTRGKLALSALRVSSRFPFHLFVKWVRHHSMQEVIVFPPLGRLRRTVHAGMPAVDSSGSGDYLGRTRGDEEFYGIREFREGDNPRRIHWRRSAGRGRLMVREMAQPRSFQLWCVVNTRVRPHDAEQTRRLDRAISAAATVMCDALERGAKIGLICNGEPFVVLPPGSGRAYRPRLMSELAIRGLNTSDDLADQIHNLTWPARWHCPCLLFGANHDEDLRAAARALTRSLGPTTLLVPGTPAFDEMIDWPDAVDGERAAIETPNIAIATRRQNSNNRHRVRQLIRE